VLLGELIIGFFGIGQSGAALITEVTAFGGWPAAAAGFGQDFAQKGAEHFW
jgi:hypothetical protein